MADDSPSFIFGGDTAVSYDELKRRRDIAAALASRSRAFPKTLGEGLTYFGEAIGDVLGDRRIRQMEAAQRAKEGGVVRGAPPGSFTPPVGGTKTSFLDGDTVPSGPAVAAGAVATPRPLAAEGGTVPVAPQKVAVADQNQQDVAPPPVGRDAVASAMLTAPEVPQENPTEAGQKAPQQMMTPGPSMPPGGLKRIQVASLDPSIGMNAVAPPEAADNPPIISDIRPQVADALAPKMVQTQRIIPDTPPALPPGVAGPPGSVPAPNAPPSREPIPGASVQEMTHPGAPPTRPPILGPSKAQAYWSQFMNNPRYSPELQAEATRRYNTEEAYRKEIETRQTGDYENTRGQYQKHKDEYDKFVREAPDRVLKQLIDRTGLEAARSKLEQDYYDKGLPRVQAARKAALEILQGERTLNKPDSVGAQGTHFERPYAPPGTPQGTFAVPAGLPPPEEKMTETQAKAVEFVTRTAPDLQLVEQKLRLGKALTDPQEAAKNAVPGVGNYLVSAEYRQARDALSNWAGAFMHHVSGAAISPTESALQLPAFIPRVGDSDQELLDKARRRRDFNSAVQSVSGADGLKKIREQVGEANDEYLFKKNSEAPVVQVKTLDDARLLPPGQRIVLPDGRPGTVPRRKRGE